MTAPIVNNFFRLSRKQIQKIGSKTIHKMETAAKNLTDDVLDVVAHRPHLGKYSIRDQVQLRTTGRKGGEFFKVQGPEIASDMAPLSPIKARTATRGKQDAEKFTEEKLNLIARFKTALKNETSEHVSPKFATEGGRLKHRKITGQTVDRYQDAVKAFKTPENQTLLGELNKADNTVETRILKQGRFQIRQTIPAMQDSEGNLTAPAKKFTVKLAQGKQETTEYVNKGLQVAKQIQERPDTIGKKFLLSNTTTQTFRGRVPSETKIQEYKKAKDSFATNERWIDDIIAQEADYAEGNYSRRLTGKNQYVVQKTAEGPKERYTLTPHKESLSQFVEKANQFAKDVAFQRPEVSPRLMVKHGHLKQGHLDSAGIKKYETAQTIFKDVPRFGAEPSTMKMRLKGNGKFSIKDVRPQPEVAEGAATNVAEKSDEPLRSIKLRQGSQDFGNFVENGIQFANLKKQHNQFMSESFGVKGNWLTGNRVKNKGLEARREAIDFFNVNAASLDELKEAGLSFKLRKHGKIALQYGQSNTLVKSLSQRNDEDLTGFLTRGVKEARAFVAEQQQKAAKKAQQEARPFSSVSGSKQRFHAQLQKELEKPENQQLPAGFSIVAQNGDLQVLKNGRRLEIHKPEAFGGQTASDFVQDAINAAHRLNEAPETPSRLNGLRNRFFSRREGTESTGRPGFWNRRFEKGKTETAAQASASVRPTISSPLEAQAGNQGRGSASVLEVPASRVSEPSGNAASFGAPVPVEQVVEQEGGRIRQAPGQLPQVENTELSRHQSVRGSVENTVPSSPMSVQYRNAPSSPVLSLPQGPPPPVPPRPWSLSQHQNGSNEAGISSFLPAQARPMTPAEVLHGASPPSPVVPSSRPASPVQVKPLREYWVQNPAGNWVRAADI